MFKSKKPGKALGNGFEWATGDVFLGKLERNPDRFGRLVDFFFFSPLISSLAPHSSSTSLSPKDQQLIDCTTSGPWIDVDYQHFTFLLYQLGWRWWLQ